MFIKYRYSTPEFVLLAAPLVGQRNTELTCRKYKGSAKAFNFKKVMPR